MEEDPHLHFGTMSPEIVSLLQPPEIFEDDPHDPNECNTVVNFITNMPKGGCQEVPQEPQRDKLRVFWYPAATTNPETSLSGSSNQRSIQERMKSFLMCLSSCLGDGVLVQFWAPIRRRSSTVLSVAGQPFGLNKLYHGLCRYRYRCMEYEYSVVEVGDNTKEPVGPIGRAFAGGFTEGFPLDFYSKEEFPLRDYALVSCGIREYLVISLFERDDPCQQHCIGVVEILALHQILLPSKFYQALKDTDFVDGFGELHSNDCEQDRWTSCKIPIYKVTEYAREVLKLPLMRLWLPCMCNFPNSKPSNTTQWFCDFLQLDHECDGPIIDYGRYGKNLVVERAYWEKKACLFKNAHQSSIWDCSIIPWMRKRGITACLAIPLPLYFPNIPPPMVELFLPPQQQGSDWNDQKVELLLKGLLSALESSLNPEQQANFDVYLSHSEDGGFVFYNVYRDGKILNIQKSTRRNLGVEKQFPSSFSDNDATDEEYATEEEPEFDSYATEEESEVEREAAMGAPITHGQVEEPENSLGGNQFQGHESLETAAEEQRFPSSLQQPAAEAATVCQNEKNEATCQTDDPNAQHKANNSRRDIDSTNMKHNCIV